MGCKQHLYPPGVTLSIGSINLGDAGVSASLTAAHLLYKQPRDLCVVSLTKGTKSSAAILLSKCMSKRVELRADTRAKCLCVGSGHKVVFCHSEKHKFILSHL